MKAPGAPMCRKDSEGILSDCEESLTVQGSIPFSKVCPKHGHDTADSVILQPHGVLIFLLAHPKRTWLKELSNLHGMSYSASFRIVS